MEVSEKMNTLVESHSMVHILTSLELKSAKYPGNLKSLVREKACDEFRLAGYIFVDGREWEDEEGWHYLIADQPLRHREAN